MDANQTKQERVSTFRFRKMFLLVFAACLSAVVCVCAVGAGEDTTTNKPLSNMTLHRWEKQNSQHGILLAIQVSKTEFRAGEKIEAEMLIRNVSGKAQRIFIPGLHGRVNVLPEVGAGSKALPVNHPMVFGRPGKQGDDDAITLEPGEFLGRRFVFDQAKPGAFTVSASYADKLDATEYLLVVESAPMKMVAR